MFTWHLFQNWLEEIGVELVKIKYGKPQQNVTIKLFNSMYSKDILDANLFIIDIDGF